MLKSLIAIGMATTLMTAPPQNTNDGTYYQDVNITETYEYETNEVNSVDDLVEGNIYKCSVDFTGITGSQLPMLYLTYYYKVDNNNNFYQKMQCDNIAMCVYSNRSTNIYIFYQSTTYLNTTGNGYIFDFYCVYQGLMDNSIINYTNFSASDYLGEKTTTITPVETEGLYNLAYHFLYSRIYTNTELQGMETTLFGTTINMNMWLSHTTAIVIICLLLIVLIKFVLWLFKIVSGGMLWK